MACTVKRTSIPKTNRSQKVSMAEVAVWRKEKNNIGEKTVGFFDKKRTFFLLKAYAFHLLLANNSILSRNSVI